MKIAYTLKGSNDQELHGNTSVVSGGVNIIYKIVKRPTTYHFCTIWLKSTFPQATTSTLYVKLCSKLVAMLDLKISNGHLKHKTDEGLSNAHLYSVWANTFQENIIQ